MTQPHAAALALQAYSIIATPFCA